MDFWFCDRLRLNFLAFAWRSIYMAAEIAVMLIKKCDFFWEIWLSEQFMY